MYLCTVAMKQQLNFFLMTYKFTISDKGSDSRQSNSYSSSLDYAKYLSIESGNQLLSNAIKVISQRHLFGRTMTIN